MNMKMIMQILKYVCLFICPLFAGNALAGVFDVIPTDKSMAYLGVIFGGSIGTVTLSGDSNPLLSNMFEKFNFIILTGGVVIISYIGVIAAVNSAREGEALGKKLNSWAIARAMMGMLLMIPTPGTGYSAIQMTIIWIVLNGIGAANAVWNVVLANLAQGLSIGPIAVTNTVTPPGSSAPVGTDPSQSLSNSVLIAATCMSSINQMNPPLAIGNNLTVNVGIQDPVPDHPTGPGDNAPTTQISQQAILAIGVPGNVGAMPGSTKTPFVDICGTIIVNTYINAPQPGAPITPNAQAFNTASVARRLAIKINGVQAMFSALSDAANLLAVPYDPNAPVTTPVAPQAPPLPTSGYVAASANAFQGQIVNLLGGIRLASSAGAPAWGNSAPPDISQSAGAATAQAIAVYGWIHAGSYYYTLTQAPTGNDLQENPTTFLPVAGQNPGIPTAYASGYFTTQNNNPGWNPDLYNQLGTITNRNFLNEALIRATTYYNLDKNYGGPPGLPAFGSGQPSTGNWITDAVILPIAKAIRDPILNWMQTLVTGQNVEPLASIGKFGWELMVAAEVALLLGIIIVIGTMLAISSVSCLNPLPFVGISAFAQIYSLIFGLLIIMWLAGATLGIYIPLVPYLIFTSTAIGWFIQVIEAIVGGPIIALAMVQPGGEELGNLKPSLGILIAVFIKPVLMIFAFVIASGLVRASIQLINFGFVMAINTSVLPTMFNVIAIVTLYVGFICAAVNQGFQIIPDMVNKILKMMGIEGAGFDASKMIEGAKGGMEKGVQPASEGLKAAGGAVGSKMGKLGGPKGGGGGGPGGGGGGGGGAPKGGGGALPAAAPGASPTSYGSISSPTGGGGAGGGGIGGGAGGGGIGSGGVAGGGGAGGGAVPKPPGAGT